MADTELNHEFAIEISGLKKRFDSLWAVDDLSFKVPSGVIAGFVGPNGSGKTTTMRVLATLLKQDEGTARVFGIDTRSEEGAKRVRHAIGFMPDYFGLYSDMTAGEYLQFFGAAYRIPPAKRDALVGDILSLVNLDEKHDTLISGLSRGMQQKLSLGRCLIHSPKLLLLDEPASGLDPRARIELMELLRELRNMGKTIFISSHILSELHSLCDMVVIIDKGKPVFTGSIEDASHGVLAGKQFLELTIGSDLESAATLIEGIEGVLSLRRKDSLVLVEHDETTSSAAILKTCVNQDVVVEEARRGSKNLEEIFMHMTGPGEE
ncbi:MAG: ABC-2 type transport system ATP-binding protein [Candidatus Promineifilaceae bacterium]|jgi:ABC-2 type transport system ATP-binding protein